MTMDELNALGQEQFLAALGGIFEDSPWVAEQVWGLRPFPSVESLRSAMATSVAKAGSEQQLTLLRAHPDLGARARMSDASQSEQAGAGLDSLNPEEFGRLTKLNAEYKNRFGFPFLYAVKGSTKHDILRALEQRIHNEREAEFQEALRQVYRIASFRLENTIC